MLVWAAVAFVVTFAVFLISLVPPQVELKVGEVSPIDVRATKEVVDEAATEALRAEIIAGVSEVYDSNPRVLDEINALLMTYCRRYRPWPPLRIFPPRIL